MNKINWTELLLCIVLASLGGIVRKLVYLEKHPCQVPDAGSYIVSSIISMFVGIIVYFLCKHYGFPIFFVIGVTGLAGFIGTPVLYTFSNVFMKKIHSKNDEKYL